MIDTGIPCLGPPPLGTILQVYSKGLVSLIGVKIADFVSRVDEVTQIVIIALRRLRKLLTNSMVMLFLTFHSGIFRFCILPDNQCTSANDTSFFYDKTKTRAPKVKEPGQAETTFLGWWCDEGSAAENSGVEALANSRCVIEELWC
ncbi:hypothetical protein Tco_0821411 [Tanacetum coccineum]|uniref:Uncharacterized protein n=1 Tax=Tanacetum coccineum TaxID=301880 RepID=A0ABQ5AES9_9ASTR